MLRQKIDRVDAEGLGKGSCETTWVKTAFQITLDLKIQRTLKQLTDLKPRQS